jgi:tetratricopeptide (TPR) repeat protein
VHYRNGAVDQRRRATELLDDWIPDTGSASSGATLRGNLQLVDGDVDAAIASYQQAVDTAVNAHQAAAAHFNRYRALAIAGRSDESREAFLNAATLDPDRVELHSAYRGRSQNMVLMTSPIVPAGAYADALDQADESLVDRATSELLQPWYGPLAPTMTASLVSVLLIALFVGAAAGPLKLTSRHCARCATPTSRRNFAEAWAASLCIFCYQLAHTPRALTLAQRGQREDRVEVRLEWWKYLQWALAPTAPGSGALLAGETLRGFVLLGLAGVGALLLASDGTRLSVPGSLGSDRIFDGRMPLGVALVTVTICVSIIDTWFRLRRRR